jgi:hypothetical protein
MLTVFSKLEKLTAFNSLELEILGDKESGLVNLQMRMRLGTITRVSKRNSITYSRVTVTGG